MTCPLCELSDHDCSVVTSAARGFRDHFPVSRGHSLVIPRVHAASLFDLDPGIQSELWRTVSAVRASLQREFNPAGFNIGVNDGVAAGQTVLHAHIHIIPRYAGDAPDPRGGIRWVLPEHADYWSKRS
jgi:diadenosine tetraphosphate (Ap4A) HIT family hydrolase